MQLSKSSPLLTPPHFMQSNSTCNIGAAGYVFSIFIFKSPVKISVMVSLHTEGHIAMPVSYFIPPRMAARPKLNPLLQK